MSHSRRRQFLIASGALLAVPFARAQAAQRVRRIGVLYPYPPLREVERFPASAQPVRLFRGALQRVGYEEGKNLILEERYAEDKVERLPALAKELVRLNVELIVAFGNFASEAASGATRTIPIVMDANMFPVERGLAVSLARPGGNVTGTVWWTHPEDSFLKVLQIVKEAMPNAKRVAHITGGDPRIKFLDRSKLEQGFRSLGLTYMRFALRVNEDLGAVLEKVKTARVEALYAGATRPVATLWPDIADFAIRQRLLSISDVYSYVDVGGLLSYGPIYTDVLNRTVSYIDRILRGAKPGELPIEQAARYVMRFNAKTARAIGFKPPSSLMLRVDDVIE